MRNRTYLIFLLLSVVKCEHDKSEWKEVKIKQGPVRGYRDSTGELWTFYNIPYATAPTKENKFKIPFDEVRRSLWSKILQKARIYPYWKASDQTLICSKHFEEKYVYVTKCGYKKLTKDAIPPKAPLPPPTWTEPFEAVDKSIMCPQFYLDLLNKNRVMEEQCLIANVYVPDTQKKNLSVLVYVHGGAFQLGFGDMLKMKNLMKHKDMIIVNFNYRLGIHGFLCLGTDNVPGNAGMKDQVTLLRWVQQNIVSFGGNPNDVTIAGCSAGSASVDLLMISKEAEGLFHKVVPESGSSLAAFTVQTDPLKIAKEHAKKLNFTDVDDIFALEFFYKSLPYETLIADPFLTNTDSTFTFSPCVEQTREGAFLTKSPYSILKTGEYKKVPLLYGFANMEGLFRMDLFEMWENRMTENFSDFLTPDLRFESEDEKEAVAKIIKEFYFGDKPVDEDNILRYVDFFSDVIFTQSSLWAVKLHIEAGHDKIYLYEYSFVDEDTAVVPHTSIKGADHCAQTNAISDGKTLTTMDEDDISEEFNKTKSILREMWRSFITTGKPVPEKSSFPAWPPVRANNSPYMSLGQKVELGDAIAPERFTFWQNIYQKYYKEPIQPQGLPSKSQTEF